MDRVAFCAPVFRGGARVVSKMCGSRAQGQTRQVGVATSGQPVSAAQGGWADAAEEGNARMCLRA